MTLEEKKIEPYLMALLASRIGNISVQMNNIMVRSARSSVLALARDCSTSTRRPIPTLSAGAIQAVASGFSRVSYDPHWANALPKGPRSLMTS